MVDFTEVPVLKGAKRCGVQHAPWMGDWFTSWSPRNDNNYAEGSWHQWANLAAMILKHPATAIVAPDLYRPDLEPDPGLYSGGNVLTEEQISEFFKAARVD